MEPCIKYAKYRISVNIAKWKVHGLLHMVCLSYTVKVFKIMSILGMRPNLRSYMISIFLHATRAEFEPLSTHVDLTFNPYWHPYRNLSTHIMNTNAYILEEFGGHMEKRHMYIPAFLYLDW